MLSILRKKSGFTLMELMIVIIVIGILAAVIPPSLTLYFMRAHDVTRVNEINNLGLAFGTYYTNESHFPDSPADGCFIKTLLPKSYLPITGNFMSPSGTGYNEGCATNGYYGYGSDRDNIILIAITELQKGGNYTGSTDGFTGVLTSNALSLALTGTIQGLGNRYVLVKSYHYSGGSLPPPPPPSPVPGVCDTSTNFACTAGTSANNNAGSCGGNATWDCLGINGGSDAHCTKANPACSNCTLPWGGSISHGVSTLAYQSASVAFPASCVSETRTCTNGTLSGTYLNQNCTVTGTPTPGVCGTASGTNTVSYPSADWCSTPTAKVDIDTVGSDGVFDWNCPGVSGGATVSCSASKTTNGVCGTASGTTTATYPSANWCGAGTKVDVDTIGGDGTFNWDCNGSGGGSNVSCSANKPVLGYPGCGTADITLGNGQVWAACNVGSSIAGTTSASYGTFFQWGRNVAFPNSGAIPTIAGPLSLTVANSTSNFIINSVSPWDWLNPQDNNRWGGSSTTDTAGTYQTVSLANQSLMQGPCATGYHVPTTKEWCDAFININPSITCTTALQGNSMILNALKIPLSGYRMPYDGDVWFQGGMGFYWSSSPYSTNSRAILFDPTQMRPLDNYYRNIGFSIRCLKNPVLNGSCGTASGTTTATYPSANWCGAGAKVDVDTVGSDGTFNWDCNGSGGGANVSCSATTILDFPASACIAVPDGKYKLNNNAFVNFWAGAAGIYAATVTVSSLGTNGCLSLHGFSNTNWWYFGGLNYSSSTNLSPYVFTHLGNYIGDDWLPRYPNPVWHRVQ